MKGKKPIIWKQEPHTAAKHQLLKSYLGGWFPILGRWSGRIVFLDGFAGPGIYDSGEPGSPVIALKTLLEHSHFDRLKHREFIFLFNEKDTERFEMLTRVVRELKEDHDPWPPNVKVQLINDAFHETVEDLLGTLAAQKANLAPTFAFVDPFGLKDFTLELLSRLVGYDKCELFVYFDFNTVNRFVTAGNIDGRLEGLFGTTEYLNVPPSGDPARKKWLHDLFERQLKDICQFQYVQSFEMVNQTGHTGYYLFYCTRNITGLALMKDAMWKVDPSGEYRFSDLMAGQEVLFIEDPDTELLQDELAAHFAGQTVSIEAVSDYVIGHTPFARKHVKTPTLKPMQAAGRITCPGQKRKGTFPDGQLISFG